MVAAETFGVVHVGTANFLDWFETREAAEAALADWQDYERGEEFAVIGFGADGMPE